MARNTSITLGDHFESFVDQSIAAGRYSSASEVVRAGLRILEVEERKLVALQAAITQGIESGIAEDFDMDTIQRELDNQ